ncbi:hypothetical protein BC962_1625 [Gillisia mitskevichiae]|uniref:Uncharacterized protein n=1 Tax=Gillisia mitskevichiae TaxID=270921 RepID=A0A495PUD5_9FLAO|nr:hypothetical protein [Gillisia mitskevichiae]RKS53375.1 hypothetical protein BC962_1625 [Gillisia mitskevichiae]
MGYTNYIGCFLLIIFIAKLISVDAKIIEFTFENDFISHVNPNCKKSQFNDSNSTSNLSLENQQPIHLLNYLCSAPYNLELFTWEDLIILDYQQSISYRVISFSSNYPKKLYPPPKV